MMTCLPPDIDPRGMYTVGKAAELLGVDRSTVRRWCNRCVLQYQLRRGFNNNQKLIRGSHLLALWQNKA